MRRFLALAFVLALAASVHAFIGDNNNIQNGPAYPYYNAQPLFCSLGSKPVTVGFSAAFAGAGDKQIITGTAK